jgi:ADP-ribose pyrophosphatase YjhB (NUDIX family)
MMPKSSKLVAARKGKLLLVRRRKDRVWTLPGGKRKQPKEAARRCLKREVREELPEIRFGRKLKRVSVRSRNQTLFVAKRVRGKLAIGDPKEIDRAKWRSPQGSRLSMIARHACKVLRIK